MLVVSTDPGAFARRRPRHAAVVAAACRIAAGRGPDPVCGGARRDAEPSPAGCASIGRRSATSLEHGTWLDRQDVEALLELPIPGIDELLAMLEIVRISAARTLHLRRRRYRADRAHAAAARGAANGRRRRERLAIYCSGTTAWFGSSSPASPTRRRPIGSSRCSPARRARRERCCATPSARRSHWVLLPESCRWPKVGTALRRCERPGWRWQS